MRRAGYLAVVFGVLAFEAAAGMAPDDLADALKGGGYVLFLRHTEAIEGSDFDTENMNNCAAQRNLSAKGKEDAKTIGRALRNRSIPVGRILASPFCRTRHAADLAFGADRVMNEYALKSVCETTPAALAERTQALRGLLGTIPAPATNTVLVSHNCNIRVVSEESWDACSRSPGAGDAVVFRPRGGGYAVVGCLPFSAFTSWADMPAKQ